MVKLTIFFRRPADISAFEDHFAHRHVPLIAAMPGVARTSVSRALGAPRGEPPYYLIHDVYFADMAALNYALNSAQGRAAGADLMMFARDIVSLMFAEVWGEDPFETARAAHAPPQAEPAPDVAAPSDRQAASAESEAGATAAGGPPAASSAP
ncbi:MAG: EthD family reductase [Thermoflexales bacterium]